MNLLRQLTKDFKETIQQVITDYKRWRKDIARKRAIKLANFKSRNNHYKRYVVYKDPFGGYAVFNKAMFLEFKKNRRGVFDRRTTWDNHILPNAVYVTPLKNEIKD